MARPWHAPLLFICVLATSLASAWVLHTRNRDLGVREFQDRQQHAVATVAAVVETGLVGHARAVRLLAGASIGLDETSLLDLLEQETRCVGRRCPTAVTLFSQDGQPLLSAVRQVALDAEQIAAATTWARDPGNAAKVRTAIARSAQPSLVLMAARRELPRDADDRDRTRGFVAEEITFDALFEPAQAVAESSNPDALLVVSGAGDVMFRSGHPEMRLNNLSKRSAQCARCHESLAHVDRMMEIERGLLTYSLRGTPQLAAVASVAFEGERWTAAAIAPASGAVAVLTAELWQLGVLAALTLVGLGIAVDLGWRDRKRRLEMAAEAARKAHLQRSHSALTAANAKLESAAEEWRMTVDTIDAAILVLDPTGTIERMNRVAADLLPGPTFSWLGKSSALLAETPPWDSALALASDAVERDAVSMARVRARETGKTWDLWCRAPHRRGNHRSVVVVARDVTALVELQASLRRSETMAALGLVVAGVAHEVRNPLFAISSLVDAWALQPQTAPQRLIDALRSEVSRLKTLMTELLEYGSPSVSELAPGRLGPLVDEAVNACRHEIDASGVRVDVRIPEDLEVWMDRRRLVRVFINLLQNAVQHSPRGALVTIAPSHQLADSSTVAIDIADEGPGFAAEDLPRLFTPFFSRRSGGFGLGLAISERIVGEHGGELIAANRPGGGAALTVTLPLGPPQALLDLSQGADRVEEPHSPRR